MAASTPITLTKVAQGGICEWFKNCTNMMTQTWSIREQMRWIDTMYQREGDQTTEQIRARIANKYGDKRKLQNVVVPVVMPQVETALAHLAAVYLSGHPIFGFVADPANEDAALQMETIIEENSARGKWVREFILWFRDGLKYNIHAMEITWDRKTIFQPITDTAFDAKNAKPKQTLWEGNCIRRMDMYNTFFDTRVEPALIHAIGEFAGYTDPMTRMQLKQFINDLPDKMIENINPAFESGIDTSLYTYYYTPLINPDALMNFDPRLVTDWLAWATAQAKEGKVRYNNMYMKSVVYGRIIPSDFNINVPARNTPQVWKFIFVNQVPIYAERQTDAHNNLPIVFGQPIEDGLRYQTKSFATNAIPFQDMASALWNAKLASERRKVGDRVLYNPLLIDEAVINSDNPSAKMPVRPAAYGRKLEEAVYQFPYRDETAGSLISEARELIQMGNLANGQNSVSQGQFQKGNKTLHEFQTVMTNANNREQLMALFIESQAMGDIKEMIKLNILQYQGAADLYNRENKTKVKIDPVMLRQAQLIYKVADGNLPVDKLVETDFLTMLFQVVSQDPELSLEYDKGSVFAYLAKLRGIRDLAQFKRTPEEQQTIVKYQEARAAQQQQRSAAQPPAALPAPGAQ